MWGLGESAVYSPTTLNIIADSATSGDIKFAAGGSAEVFRISKNTNVSIGGISAPADKLSLNANTGGGIRISYPGQTTSNTGGAIQLGGLKFANSAGGTDAIVGQIYASQPTSYTNTTGDINLSVYTGSTVKTVTLQGADGALRPGLDNSQKLGSTALRWSTIYAATSAINTSDARYKTPLKTLSTKEIEAAVEIADSIGLFQFIEDYNTKGEAVARFHSGSTVQKVIDIFERKGLNPFRYAFICHDKWDEQKVVIPAVAAVLDDNGVEITPAQPERSQVLAQAGDRYGFRTDELLLFVTKAMIIKQKTTENRLIQLENTVRQLAARVK